MACHWFGRSQFRLPNEPTYNQLQVLLGDTLSMPYQDIKGWEEQLFNHQTKPAQRHFEVAQTDWYTDIWQCMPVQYYKGKHPCEKPMAIMEQIIKASSRTEDIVLDPFMGGGTTGVAAIQNGRQFIGCELDQGYFESAQERLAGVINMK